MEQNGPFEEEPLALAEMYEYQGADGILLIDCSASDEEHEAAIGRCKEIARNTALTLYMAGNVKRLEDVKKYLYAGAAAVLLDPALETDKSVYPEARERFGAERVRLTPWTAPHPLLPTATQIAGKNGSWEEGLLPTATPIAEKNSSWEEGLLPTATPIAEKSSSWEEGSGDSCLFLCRAGKEADFHGVKRELKQAGIPVITYESKIPWEEFKKNSDGLMPVVVQDYRTGQVLMMAYMDEAAYQETVEGGRMCYYSRSRQQRWLKGETSGHYQYVKSLYLDCDSDTILAKVAQVGAACHTGSYSCFFKELLDKHAIAANPHKVLEDVYGVIADRKLHPKEGSYTNYLFDKGIDKILKKCGEEATEIVIAAKNPDPEEIKYEISDFLYHVMVLMVEKNVTWEDIMRELANR